MRGIRPFVLLGGVALLGCGDNVTEPPDAELIIDRIAFASTRGSSWSHIYLANSDGTGVTRLTLGSAPSWSWDGRRIAFYRDANPYDRQGIYVIESDRGSASFVTHGQHAAWSPSGELAVSGYFGIILREGQKNRTLLPGDWLRETGGEPCGEDPWFRAAAASPAWTPDGAQISFLLTCGSEWSRPFVMDAAGGVPRRLLEWEMLRAGPAAWAPDGSALALIDDDYLFIFELDSDGGSLAFDLSADVEGLGRTVDWSPDSRQLVLEAGEYDRRRIFIMPRQGGQIRQLVPDTFPDFYNDFDVAWSRATP